MLTPFLWDGFEAAAVLRLLLRDEARMAGSPPQGKGGCLCTLASRTFLKLFGGLAAARGRQPCQGSQICGVQAMACNSSPAFLPSAPQVARTHVRASRTAHTRLAAAVVTACRTP